MSCTGIIAASGSSMCLRCWSRIRRGIVCSVADGVPKGGLWDMFLLILRLLGSDFCIYMCVFTSYSVCVFYMDVICMLGVGLWCILPPHLYSLPPYFLVNFNKNSVVYSFQLLHACISISISNLISSAIESITLFCTQLHRIQRSTPHPPTYIQPEPQPKHQRFVSTILSTFKTKPNLDQID